MTSEAKARIKINQKLEKAGWRFFDDEHGKANIELESHVKLTKMKFNEFGEDFEKTEHGFLDFLLLDEDGFPFVVLEAKKEDRNPLDGKEQARAYANSENIRFVILSNGNVHYFWDMYRGNPEIITEFPTVESLKHRLDYQPDPRSLYDEKVTDDYIVISQDAAYKNDPRWLNPQKHAAFIEEKELNFLRPYQLNAVKALQEAVRKGNDRFLFEMATGTGKTLVAAAVVKLFLRTGNSKRILFLVDRIELERQAHKSFKRYLHSDYSAVIYKENRTDWKKAEIVISTVQSLASNNKYLKLFSPTDFDLIISDEAHRSINGNARAVFEYFVGYKLGLTATPKDYLKNINVDELNHRDPRAWERRQLLDTYATFGCASGVPTFRYSLLDGVRDGYLVNPIVVDARTEITTQLLSEQGYAVRQETEEGEESEHVFFKGAYERHFFSEHTNQIMCKTFLENALRDPLSKEIGKSIVFCVSQEHASKITQLLNQYADQMFPGMYNSDFALQITSNIMGAQDHAMQFANNKLNGITRFLENYKKSSKTRVCVTVGMMTTGYDCRDILNLCMMRPIFSPTDFIQIKGRGTRTFTFQYERDQDGRREKIKANKEHFKLFDFFANCEYFEKDFNYDEILKLPVLGVKKGIGETEPFQTENLDEITVYTPDPLKTYQETPIGLEGMEIDRQLFGKLAKPVRKDEDIQEAIKNDQWERAIQLFRERYENKPELYVTLEKLRQAEHIDRRLTWKEVLQRIFGMIDHFKSKDELLEEEVDQFIAIHKPEARYVRPIQNFMKAYLTDPEIRKIVDAKEYAHLATNPKLSMADIRALNGWRDTVPQYIKDYIVLNTYMN
jgi:type I restriction enzyme R subunit